MAKASDFVQAPLHLLVPSRALGADLYIFFQLNSTIVHFRRKGDTLTERDLASLEKVPRNCVLIPRTQWAEVMAFAVDEISMELERSERVDSPAVREAAKSVLGGLDSASPAAALESLTADGAKAATPAESTLTPERQAELAREALAEAATLVEKILLSVKKNRSTQAYEQVINEWREEKNPFVSHHRQVSAMSVLFLLVLGGASYEEFTDIGFAGLIHDLGLLGVPPSIMQRHILGAESFNPSEKMVFMKHVDTTLEVVKAQGLAITPGAARIVQQHHENWDGSGFKGVRGAQIYRPARILRLADGVVSRMNNQGHEGGFREAISALAVEIGSGGEPVYDPGMVSALVGELDLSRPSG